MDDYSLRRKGPWHGTIEKVPEGHEVLAEFPSVVWGWEADLYAWILRDPSGRKYIGTTSHGGFCEQPLANIAEEIAVHEAMVDTLQQVFTSITQ
jgi:hypothetical protein